MIRSILGTCLILALGVPAASSDGMASTPPHRLEGPTNSVGVTFQPVAAFALGDEIDGFGNVVMRASILTVAPSGTPAVHDHWTRPAFAWVLEGEPVEMRDDHADPIRHAPGSVSREFGITHFWRNPGEAPARLLVIDLVRAGSDIGVALDQPDRRAEQPGFTGPPAAVGARVTVQGEIDLAAVFPEIPAARGKILRARRIDLEPGARSHLHRHEDAPSFTFVASGTVIEHRNDQPETPSFSAGMIAIDRAGMAHWWEVSGDQPVVFLVGEVVKR